MTNVQAPSPTRTTSSFSGRACGPSTLGLREHLIVVGLYLIAAIGMTYPLVRFIGQGIPGDAGGDAGQTVWTLWWVAESIRHGDSPFFTHLIFYPAGVSLVSQALDLVDAVVFLPVELFWGPMVEYNVAVLFAFVATGYGAYLLGRHLTGSALAGFVCGFAFAYGPFHTVRLLGHFVWITIEWVPLAVLFMIRSLETGAWRDRIWAAAFWVLAGLCNWYLAIFLGIFFALAIGWQASVRRCSAEWRRTLIVAVSTAGTALLAVLPLVVPMGLEALHEPYLQRPEAEAIAYSADVLDYLIPSPLNPWVGHWVSALTAHMIGRSGIERTVYLGITVVALAAFGTLRRRPASLFWLLTASTFFVLSLGPLLHVDGTPLPIRIAGLGVPLPFQLLWHVPVMQLTHVPARFGLMVALAIDVLVAFGVEALIGILRRSAPAHYMLGSVGAIVALIGAEFLVVPIPFQRFSIPAFYQRLAASPDHRAIVEVPITPTGTYQLYQTFHHRPMVGGYLPRTPPDPFADGSPGLWELAYFTTQDIIDQDPVLTARSFLRRSGIGHVILHKDLLTPSQLAMARAYLSEVLGPGAVIEDDPSLLVFEVDASALRDGLYLSLGSNWFALEATPDGPRRWMSNDGVITIHSPRSERVRLEFTAQSLETARNIEVRVGGQVIASSVVGVASTTVTTDTFQVSPGDTTVEFHSLEPPRAPVDLRISADTRPLSLDFSRIRIEPVMSREAALR
jgi:hypothetical protein